MRYYHDQHIGVYENAISDEWCDKIVEYFEKNIKNASPREGIFGANSVRDTNIFLNENNLQSQFNNFLSQCLSKYVYKYPSLGNSLIISKPKIQRTFPTEGYHPYHHEQGIDDFTIRRIGAYTLYLNDVKEGGETEFLYQLKRIKPKKGTVCIFPASYTHVHRGNTPFSGEKYIITGWLELPKEENIGS